MGLGLSNYLIRGTNNLLSRLSHDLGCITSHELMSALSCNWQDNIQLLDRSIYLSNKSVKYNTSDKILLTSMLCLYSLQNFTSFSMLCIPI